MRIRTQSNYLLTALIIVLFIIPLCLSCGNKDQKEAESESIIEEFGPIFDLGEMIVNLSDSGQARYAKVVIVLELSSDEAYKEAIKRDPQVRDIVIELLSSEKAVNILSLEGRETLKEKIKKRIDIILPEGEVRQIYFTTVVVQ